MDTMHILQRKISDKGAMLKKEYYEIGIVEIICENKHSFKDTYSNIIGGKWCHTCNRILFLEMLIKLNFKFDIGINDTITVYNEKFVVCIQTVVNHPDNLISATECFNNEVSYYLIDYSYYNSSFKELFCEAFRKRIKCWSYPEIEWVVNLSLNRFPDVRIYGKEYKPAVGYYSSRSDGLTRYNKIIDYARLQFYDIKKFYVDNDNHDIKIESRITLNQLLEEIERCTVICITGSDLSEDLRDLISIEDILCKKHCSLIFIDQNINTDTSIGKSMFELKALQMKYHKTGESCILQ